MLLGLTWRIFRSVPWGDFVDTQAPTETESFAGRIVPLGGHD